MRFFFVNVFCLEQQQQQQQNEVKKKSERFD